MKHAEKTFLLDLSYELVVTLDGQPAVISGRLNDFAMVRTLDGSQSFEWSWDTVGRILRAAESKGQPARFLSGSKARFQ